MHLTSHQLPSLAALLFVILKSSHCAKRNVMAASPVNIPRLLACATKPAGLH